MSTSETGNNKTIKAEKRNLVGGSIKTVDRWIRGINDPELGDIGQSLLTEFKGTGCRELVDLEYKALACYSSFSYRTGQQGFVNTILYGPTANENLTKLFSAKVHEMTHVLQTQKSAALHADPFNPATQIIVCPRDWITLQEHCEEAAYVNQTLFNSLFMQANPDIAMVTDRDCLSVAEFNEIRDAAPNMAVAFNRAARQSLNKRFYWNSKDENYFSFRNHYQYNALDGFKAGMRMRARNNENGFVFVRITPEDIKDVSAFYGLNNLRGDCGGDHSGQHIVTPSFVAPPQLRDRAHGDLATLNKTLGITDENTLPTLAEALEAAGLDVEKFMAQSKFGGQYKAPCTP